MKRHEDPAAWAAAVARAREAGVAFGSAAEAIESMPVAGGVVAFGGVGSWMNQAVGCGMNGPVSSEEVDAIVDFHASRGIEPKVEVSTRADSTLLQHTGAAGFRLRGFEECYAFDLADPLPDPPADVRVRQIDPADEAELDTAVELAERASRGDETAVPTPEERDVAKRMLRLDWVRGYIAEIDGEPVGYGTLGLSPTHEGLVRVAHLWAGSTRAAFRRRSVQRAMMLHRMAVARDSGYEAVLVDSAPGVATARNARRLGFVQTATIASLVRPGEGLIPSP